MNAAKFAYGEMARYMREVYAGGERGRGGVPALYALLALVFWEA